MLKPFELPERLHPEPPPGTYELNSHAGTYHHCMTFKWQHPFDEYDRPAKASGGYQRQLYLMDVRSCCGVRYLCNFGYPYNARPASPEELQARLSYVEQGIRSIIEARRRDEPQHYVILQAFIAGTAQHEHFLPLLEHYGFTAGASGRNHNGYGNLVTLMQRTFE